MDFFLKFPGRGKSWKMSLVLESPVIYLWFNLTNMPFMLVKLNQSWLMPQSPHRLRNDLKNVLSGTLNHTIPIPCHAFYV